MDGGLAACPFCVNCVCDEGVDDELRRYATQLRLLEHRYLNADGKRCGGIRVSDYLNHQPTLKLYEDVPLDLSAFGL